MTCLFIPKFMEVVLNHDETVSLHVNSINMSMTYSHYFTIIKKLELYGVFTIIKSGRSNIAMLTEDGKNLKRSVQSFYAEFKKLVSNIPD